MLKSHEVRKYAQSEAVDKCQQSVHRGPTSCVHCFGEYLINIHIMAEIMDHFERATKHSPVHTAVVAQIQIDVYE